MSAPAECLRIGDTTLKVPVPATLAANGVGLTEAIKVIPRDLRNEIADYHLDRAYTDQAGQRWFLIKVVWRMP